MTRTCENGSDLAAKFKGLLGGGPYEVTLAVRLALRDVRPCVAQGCQQYFLLAKMYALMSRGRCLQVGFETHDVIVFRRGLLPAEEDS